MVTTKRTLSLAPWLLVAALVAGCGGGGGSSSAEAGAQQGGGAVPTDSDQPTAGSNCTGSCADATTFLEPEDVEQVIAQAVAAAEPHNLRGTIAVVDRVGNVLAVYRMAGADPLVTVTSTADGGAPVIGGLEGVNIVPATLAAVAKAITGAYLSTEGNAFTTRTANQIVQENFNPGEVNQPSGPLFGVQFSQLPCGDFVRRAEPALGPTPGPHRSPLGLAADPGGFPLYKGGTAVGGVGVMTDGIYGLDPKITGFDRDFDEIVGLAATVGFAPSPDRKADVITVIGKTLRYSDWSVAELLTDAATVTPFDQLVAAGNGGLVPVAGYHAGTEVHAGTAFGQPASGIRPAAAGRFVGPDGADTDAFVFVDAANDNRFPPRAGTDAPGGDPANALTAEEVRTLLGNALAVANRARAQIRRPLGTPARVTISVVDSSGAILGMARTRDGPVFGADVSLQKARTAAFFSGTGRVGGPAPADVLEALPGPVYLDAVPDPAAFAADPAGELGQLQALANPDPEIGDYVRRLQVFLGIPDALEADGPPAAFADRSGGNLARPNFPDGVQERPPGPLSKPQGQWSVFSTGLQLDLAYNAVIQHVASTVGLAPDVGTTCTGNTGFDTTDFPNNLFQVRDPAPGLANGIQIFPGSVPIYRGDVLVGGIGVSGDGVDQDDMISLLGVHNAAEQIGGVNNAPQAIRADTIDIPGVEERLRYVSCPQAPFIDTDEDDVCDGK